MVRIRHGWLVVVLGLAFALAAGCKKDDAGGGGGSSGSPLGLSGNAVAAADLALIPRDSEMVFGINVLQLQQSALWKQLVEPKLMAGDALRKIGEFKAKCGVDPMTSVKSVTIGVKNAPSNTQGVVVVHGLDKAKAMACLDSMKDDMAKDGAEVVRDGDVVTFKNTRSSSQAVLTYVNDTTALAVFGEQANAATLKAVQASSDTLKSSKPFLDMYGKIRSSDSLWLLVSGNVLEKGRAIGMKAKSVYGSLNVTDGLSIDMRVLFETPADADSFEALSKSQAKQAAKQFDKVDITKEGAEVRYSIALSSQKLKELIAQVMGMLSMFGGM